MPRAPVAVVIPAHDEAASLPFVLDELAKIGSPKVDVLVVDDASVDGTPALLQQSGAPFLRLPLQLGVGGAMRAGLRLAVSRGYQTVARLDGDGQHRAADLEAMLAPIVAGEADAVLGSRHLGSADYDPGTVRRLVRALLAVQLSWLTRQKVTDPTSGYWAFGPRALALLSEHHPTGYPEPELILLLRREGLRLVEVPVQMRARAAGRTTLTLSRALHALARAWLALLVVPLRRPQEHAPRD